MAGGGGSAVSRLVLRRQVHALSQGVEEEDEMGESQSWRRMSEGRMAGTHTLLQQCAPRCRYVRCRLGDEKHSERQGKGFRTGSVEVLSHGSFRLTGKGNGTCSLKAKVFFPSFATLAQVGMSYAMKTPPLVFVLCTARALMGSCKCQQANGRPSLDISPCVVWVYPSSVVGPNQ